MPWMPMAATDSGASHSAWGGCLSRPSEVTLRRSIGRHVMETRQDSDFSKVSYEVELREMREALAASHARCEQLAHEVHALREGAQATWHGVQSRDAGNQARLAAAQEAAQRRAAEAEGLRAVAQRSLDAEMEASGKLRAEMEQLRLDLAAGKLERLRLRREQVSSESYAVEARSGVDEEIRFALEKQRRAHDEALRRERAAHAEAVAGVVTRETAQRALAASAELWRTGAASAHCVGRHAHRAEQAARELVLGTRVVAPEDEAVMEPLRRAVGDDATRDMARELARVLRGGPPGTGPGQASALEEGWARHAEVATDAGHLRRAEARIGIFALSVPWVGVVFLCLSLALSPSRPET
mmetsp:Transcript_126668/g.404845  ORF Transcript_126668/g.404845 Transcript_126668/m.404845 type:complete len:356 (+) Transcript_126668:249-1316(+)